MFKTLLPVALATLTLLATAHPLALAASPADPAPTRNAPPAASTSTSTWTCQAFYLPARSIWPRVIAVDYDGSVVRDIRIDGVAVYTFNVTDTSLMTAVDGERIQFDVAALSWTSDLRGMVSSAGRCAP